MGNGKPYEFPNDWDSYTVEEKQRFFDEFRERVYNYWFRNAQHSETTGTESFKVDEVLY